MANRFKKARLATAGAATAASSSTPPAAASQDDYMSAAFTTDHSPPLPASGDSSCRKRGAPGQHIPQPPPKQQLSKKETAALAKSQMQEGLDTPIAPTNPGFRLLMKLGWQRERGLGRGGGGMTTPLAPSLRQGRSGVGHQSAAAARRAAQQVAAQEAAERARAAEAHARRTFRSSKSGEFLARRLSADLSRARRLVQELDENTGVSGRTPLWPPEPSPEEGDETAAAAEQATVAHSVPSAGERPGTLQLPAALGAAAAAGAATASSAAAAAPAEAAAAHTAEGESNVEVEDEDGASPAELLQDWDALSEAEQLACCAEYLRSVHAYCMYCGVSYEGQGDMDAHCPGASREDHDAEEL